MKIYFTASRAGNKQFGEHYKKIIGAIKKEGFKVQADHIINDAPQPHEKNFHDYYRSAYKWIKEADMVVAEISTPSSGVGHEIFLALNNKKPVLALLNENAVTDRDATLKGNPSKLLVYEKYDDKNLTQVIRKFIGKSKTILDTKFILIIPPEIDRYLEWASDYKRMHKAQVVREAIENFMAKDQDWQDFTKEE